ncbi:MAG: hypothetical protein H6709_00190 [Kofleriaceae bacterium]|nr:hypothetical protein [Kofleriaceae bacterium]
MAARREVAWAAVARALTAVPFAIDPPSGVPAELPRWATWYGADDLRRLFDRLFRGLDPDAQRARAPFGDAALDAAFAWNPTAVDELASWPADRWQAYLDAIDDAAEVHGIGGIPRVTFSPGAARHLLASYAPIVACEGQPAPPAFADAPTAGPQRMAHEVVDLAACERRGFGPYYVGDGERLTAAVAGAGAAAVRVRVGAPPAGDVVDCEGATCDAAGPGAIYVEVAAEDAGTFTLDVSYQEADPTWAPCLGQPFPLDAAIAKAEWRRAELDLQVAVHDTSADGLTALVDDTWGDGQGELDPGPDDIYTVQLPEGGARYRLTGLHLMTKELDHWLWITLWWSPEPDTDFGADRPAAIAALPGPWAHYKMCAVTWFTEGDDDPGGGAADPTLAEALAAVHERAGPSFCSNPYLEQGAGNARTNCVGCHQHGGTTIANEDILTDEATYPGNGRLQVRNNFPADYSWQTSRGGLGRMFLDEIEYWTPAP